MKQNANTFTQLGDFYVETLDLINTRNEAINLIDAFLQVDIYESLLDTSITGMLTMIDANDIALVMDLNDYDRLEISFKTAGFQTPMYRKTFIVHDSEVEQLNDKSQVLRLYFESEERIDNKTVLISQAFNGLISDTVNAIFATLNSPKTFDVVKSKNIFRYFVPFKNPFEAIKFLQKKAISENDEYGYLFYENKQGYNFKPVQSLYDQPVTKEFYYNIGNVRAQDSTSSDTQLSVKFSSILDFDIIDNANSNKKAYGDVLGNQLGILDIYNKQYNVRDFNYFTHSVSRSIEETVQTFVPDKDFTRSRYSVSYYNTEATPHQDMYRDYYQANTSILKQVMNEIVNITTYGDSDLTIGQVVTATIPSRRPRNNNDSFDEYSVRGKYLVGAVSHTLTQEDYKCVVGLWRK